jgi:hypothetical protein
MGDAYEYSTWKNTWVKHAGGGRRVYIPAINTQEDDGCGVCGGEGACFGTTTIQYAYI